MPYKEHNIEKKYYAIGEVAAMFKVNASLIRFWESEFDSVSPRKNKKGIRQFTSQDIESIKIVYHLVKERGFTLQGAKDKIKGERAKIHSNIEAIDALKSVKGFLEELKSKL
jgi:DNA-binding transcriptional MerR regulator